jgi:hypothetical protein
LTLLHLLDGSLLHAPSRMALSAYSTPCTPRSLAAALGIAIPNTLIALADEMIE